MIRDRGRRIAVAAIVVTFLVVNWRYPVATNANSGGEHASDKPKTPVIPSTQQHDPAVAGTVARAPPAPSQALLPLEPFRCSARRATMKVPRNRSDLQASPSGVGVCCTPVKNDWDLGLTMYHLLTRYLCAVHRSPFRVAVDAPALARASEKPGDAMPRAPYVADLDPAAAGDVARATAPQRVRVLQIGANTGDNENDHLFRFLRQKHWAEAVLVEPVPWLFSKLSAAYKGLSESGVVTLVNAAVGTEDGTLPFYAPLPDAPGWVKQMGGFKITPRNMNVLKKKRMTRYIKETTVNVKSVRSVLNVARPSWRGRLPHVVVIDTEGFDAKVVHMLLDEVTTMRHDLAESGNGKAAQALAIPIVQYEWKHLSVEDNDAVMARLRGLGYCVLWVNDDTLAYHASIFDAAGKDLQCDVGFDVTFGP